MMGGIIQRVERLRILDGTRKKRRRLSSFAEVKVVERRMRRAMPTKGNNAIQINHITWYGNLNRNKYVC